MDNIENLKHRQYSSDRTESRSSIISNRINWEDELTDRVHRDIPAVILSKFDANFNRVIHQKYLHWLSESYLADFLDSHLRFHLRDLWGQEKYLAKRSDFNSIKWSEVIGMHDIYYLAAAAFYHAIGYDRSEFKGYWSAAKYCGLWWAFYDVAVVIPKPSIIHLDNEYRLHAERKPALVYRGFESYAHHGKYIDSKLTTNLP